MALDLDAIRTEIAKELGMEDLSPERQEKLIALAIETLLEKIHVDTIEKLGDAGAEAYLALLEKNPSEEEVAEFLRSRIENYDVFVSGIVTQFKQDVRNAGVVETTV